MTAAEIITTVVNILADKRLLSHHHIGLVFARPIFF